MAVLVYSIDNQTKLGTTYPRVLYPVQIKVKLVKRGTWTRYWKQSEAASNFLKRTVPSNVVIDRCRSARRLQLILPLLNSAPSLSSSLGACWPITDPQKGKLQWQSLPIGFSSISLFVAPLPLLDALGFLAPPWNSHLPIDMMFQEGWLVVFPPFFTFPLSDLHWKAIRGITCKSCNKPCIKSFIVALLSWWNSEWCNDKTIKTSKETT